MVRVHDGFRFHHFRFDRFQFISPGSVTTPGSSRSIHDRFDFQFTGRLLPFLLFWNSNNALNNMFSEMPLYFLRNLSATSWAFLGRVGVAFWIAFLASRLHKMT